MTHDDHEPDAGALDAMLERIAAAHAPGDFTARVSQALDASHASPVAGRRVSFVIAAAAGVLAIVIAVWIASRHPETPSTPVPSSASTRTLPANARPASEVVPQPTTTPTAALAVAPVRAARGGPHRSHSQVDDHDRALPALASLPGLGPRDISPATLHTAPLEIDRIDDIAPLTIQSGRDTSGRGDF